MNKLLNSVSFMAVAVLATTPAHAQSTQPAAPAESASDGDSQEIIVTGSRLGTTELTSVAPVVSVSRDLIASSGKENIADVLTDLPQIGVGLSGANTQNQATAVGLNLVNLRKLGTQRTLVLVNGRRQVAGEPMTAAVDLNSIPSALVERVEVVTGGTSAVYGADAVSGVVNLILKKDFEGLEIRGHGGITSRGDGESYGFDLTAGQNFADGRGNVSINFLYDKVQGVGAADRSYGINGLNTISNPANTGNNDGIPNFITAEGIRFVGSTVLGSTFTSLGQTIFSADGRSSRPYDYGQIGNRFGRSIGGDGGFFEKYDNLSLPIERYGLSANLNYEIADNINLFFEGRYNKSKVKSFWQPVADDFQYAAPEIEADNPFIPADFRAAINGAGIQSFPFFRVYEDFGRRGSDVDRTTQQYTLGFDGDLGGSWKYNVFAGYGHTGQSTILLNGRNQDRFLESVDVITLGGQAVCRDPAARARGCVPLNVFNPSATPAGIEYSRTDDVYYSSTSLRMAGASLNGELVQLPAGPLEVALGVEAREAKGRTRPSDALQSGRIFYPQESPVSGSIKVKEAFGEIRVPILEDVFLIKELTLQAAGRVSDYNNNGTQTSWNVGGSYAPVEDLRFRVMRSKSVRAPNIGELFSPVNQSFFFVQDPCDLSVINQAANRPGNCAALGIPSGYIAPTNGRTIPASVGGNTALDVETAKTWTVGAVFTPSFLPGLTASVDFYDIKIGEAIGIVPIQTILNNCVDLAGPPSGNPLCGLITRDATTKAVTNVLATAVNIGKFETRGIDFSVNYRTDLTGLDLPGRLTFGVTGTYLDKLRQFTDANDPRSENKLEGQLGNPKWEMLGTVTYAIDPVEVTWRTHYLGSTSILSSVNVFAGIPADQFDRSRTGAEIYNDLSINYNISDKANVRFTVNNIFDNKPPARPFLIHSGIYDAALYPNLGTNFSLSASYRF
jgi:iron complex outermembrane receptor protein